MKVAVIIILFIVSTMPEIAFSKVSAHKKNKKNRVLKVVKFKSKRKHKKSFGPDLKQITIESTFDDSPENGINNIEKM